ncbi:MAG TPA: T9SS type A sorting domain-containing protein, partial [Salinivirgaceae bacterium]|nr:T9SS type A sorting domain-containing protein [Salinivirgaceae bacterium]
NQVWLLPSSQNLTFSVSAVGVISGQISYTVMGPQPTITFANIQYPGSATVEIGASVDIYSQVTVENATIGSNGVEGMQVWVGIHTENTNPSGWTQWNLATWNGLGMYSNRPEYKYTLNTTGMAEGMYYYASRFKLGNGEYVYGGYSSTGGGYWDGTNNVSGVLTLQQQIQTFPVTFTVTNENPAVTMIYIKGSFNGWTEVAMENSGGNQWTKTFNIPAGNYEWGITDQNQVWLLPSSQNLTFSVSATGVITGQTSYTVQGGGTGNASILDRWIIYQGSQVVYVGGSEFNGSQLGAFNTNQSLILKGAGLKTFKEGIYDITGASIFYRVHPVGNATGSYQVVNLPWKENLPEAGQQVWEEAEQNINLINGLAPGQYQIEIYFEAYYKIGDQTAIYTFVDNNNGNNYSAGFTVSQTTGINDLGAEIRFFPNPVSDLLIVSTKSKLESIEVFDFNGNLLGRTNESEIRLSHLVNGLYIVKIVTESEVLYGKVLKSN